LLPVLHDVVVGIPDKPGEFARVAALLAQAEINIKDVEVLSMREDGGALRLGFQTLEEAAQAREVLQQAGYTARGKG
jgi:prephenate dehydrogenase